MPRSKREQLVHGRRKPGKRGHSNSPMENKRKWTVASALQKENPTEQISRVLAPFTEGGFMTHSTCVIDRDRMKKAKHFLGLVLLVLKIVLAILKLMGNR